MSQTTRPSVAVLTNAPTPYRTPFFNELAKHCRLLMVFDAMREPGREWDVDEETFEFEYVVTRARLISFSRRLAGRRSRTERRVLSIPLNVISVLNRFEPDVVVSPEFGVRTASAAVFCRLRRKPLIIWWEGTPHSERAASAAKVWLRKQLLGSAARAWSNGEESSRVLTEYGLYESRIDEGMTGIDTTHWRTDVDDARVASRTAIREQLGLCGVVLLFVGGLTHRKGVPELLSALTLVAERDLPAWSVFFVGSGPLDEEIQEWARRHPAVPLRTAGFVQPAELAQYFAAADLFVMPSVEDVWGMVCVEALVAGLPQVTSSLAGAASSIVTSSEVGTVVNPCDTASLADQLSEQIRLGIRRVPDSRRDRAMIEWSPEAFAERAMSSIRSSLGIHA